MFTYRFPVVLFFAAQMLPAPAGYAQLERGTTTGSESGSTAADTEWAHIRENSKARETVRGGGVAKSSSRVALERADQSKSFYSKYPAHPQARAAKRAEIIALLDATIDNDPATEKRLNDAARAFRTDPTNSERDRAIIAGFHSFHLASLNLKSQNDYLISFEKVARDLISEFPAQPQGYESLLTVARENEEGKSLRLARELVASSAPQDVKVGAEKLTTQLSLKGRVLVDVLPALSEARKPLKPVVIYGWSSWSQSSLIMAQALGKRHRDAAIWIGLNLDLKTGRAAAEEAAEVGNFPGRQIYDDLGTEGDIATKLGVAGVPFVYLLDGSGVVRDVRGLIDLEKKLTDAGL